MKPIQTSFSVCRLRMVISAGLGMISTWNARGKLRCGHGFNPLMFVFILVIFNFMSVWAGWLWKYCAWSVLPQGRNGSFTFNWGGGSFFLGTFLSIVMLFLWFNCTFVEVDSWGILFLLLSILLWIVIILCPKVTLLEGCICLNDIIVVSPWNSSCLRSHLLNRTRFLEISCNTAVFIGLLHLSHRSLGEIFYGSDSIFELFQIESCIGIQVHSSNDWDQKSIVGINAAFNKETFQIWCINEVEVTVINSLVQFVQIVIISRCQILFQHLCLSSQLQLFLQKFAKVPLYIISQELTIANRVSWSLWCLCS